MRGKHWYGVPIRATAEWLAPPPPERLAFLDAAIRSLLARYPAVRLRFFDSEAYNARLSDVVLWETADLSGWDSLAQALRETPLWGRYFDVLEILPAVENGYSRHRGTGPVSA